MTQRKRFSRLILLLTLLIALCAGMFSPRVEGVKAKPLAAAFGEVIISEVAWGGTAVNSGYEWIELYNTTGNPITLTNWTIAAADLSPTITISSGVIPAYGYFLLEANESAVPNQSDVTYSGTLSNTNETLTLRDGPVLGGNTIDTANSGCSGCWYAGSGSPDYFTMQRVGTTTDSPSAWVSGIGTPRNSQIDLSLSMNFVSSTGTTPPYDVTFSINLTNEGYGTAFNVQVDDNLSTFLNLAFVSYTASTGTYNSTTGIWDIVSIPSGTSATLTIIATVTSAIGEPYAVSATIARSEKTIGIPALDSDGLDNIDSIKIGSSRLGITNTVNNPTPNVGANVVFSITVNNPTGPIATGVFVDAKLPSGLSFVSASSPAYTSNTGVWSVPNLATGANDSLTITAQVLSTGIMSLIADVSSVEFANNSVIATVTPIPSTQADLTLTQTWARSTSAADTAILSLVVTNQDPVNVATNVQVRDLLPTGLTYVSHTSGLNYNSSTGIWAVGTILGGGTSTLSITVKVSPSGTSTTNFAEVWLSDQFDIDSTPGNGDVGEDDGSNSEVLVSDLNLTQTSNITSPNAVFTIRVTNNGPDDATNVKVSNSRLSNLASYLFISASVPAGTIYTSGSGEWNIGSLANGATVTLIVTTTLVSPDENLAEISSVTEIDPDSLPANGSRTEDDDAASPSADLSLTQTILSPAPYVNSDLNSNVTFRITVSNAGYANATGVEVKDLLPPGLTYVSHTSGQTYNSASGIWSVGALNSLQSRTLDIVAKVTTLGIRTNWAEVWKSTQSDPDSNPGDGSTIDDDDAGQAITSYRAVIFNEIAWMGTTANVEDEWIELYNPSDTEITITGWQIKKNSCSGAVYITLSGKVSRDGYFLLERGDTSTDNTAVSETANQIYLASTTPALSDSGETLYLCDNFGNFIDTANGNGGGWPAGNTSSVRPSMERLNTSTESDGSWIANNGSVKNGTNASGGAIYGTPGKKNSTSSSSSSTAPTVTPVPTSTPISPAIPIPPRPIINEILARPGFDWNQDGVTDVFDEFIEIKNLTAIDISLTGWTLDKVVPAGTAAKSFALPDVTLKPGERIVFYSKQTNLLLSDGGETVRLINSSDKIYDAFTYDIARAEDKSFCRLPDGTPGNSWFEDCIPTPSLNNTREGKPPVSPDNSASPFCNLPDTIPLDFFIPECNGFGGDIWNPFYWDFTNWLDKLFIQTDEKWRTFIE